MLEDHIDRTLLLEADPGERWDLADNQSDLVRLLDLPFDLANGVGDDPPRKRAVFILAGDIHAATMHLIRSLPEAAACSTARTRSSPSSRARRSRTSR